MALLAQDKPVFFSSLYMKIINFVENYTHWPNTDSMFVLRLEACPDSTITVIVSCRKELRKCHKKCTDKTQNTIK